MLVIQIKNSIEIFFKHFLLGSEGTLCHPFNKFPCLWNFYYFPFQREGCFRAPLPPLFTLSFDPWELGAQISTYSSVAHKNKNEFTAEWPNRARKRFFFLHKGTTITLRGRLFVTLGPRFFAQLSFLTSLEFRTLTFFDRISNGNSCTIQSWQKIRYEPKNISKTLP